MRLGCFRASLWGRPARRDPLKPSVSAKGPGATLTDGHQNQLGMEPASSWPNGRESLSSCEHHPSLAKMCPQGHMTYIILPFEAEFSGVLKPYMKATVRKWAEMLDFVHSLQLRKGNTFFTPLETACYSRIKHFPQQFSIFHNNVKWSPLNHRVTGPPEWIPQTAASTQP